MQMAMPLRILVPLIRERLGAGLEASRECLGAAQKWQTAGAIYFSRDLAHDATRKDPPHCGRRLSGTSLKSHA
jgi:hypothetical protein